MLRIIPGLHALDVSSLDEANKPSNSRLVLLPCVYAAQYGGYHGDNGGGHLR